MAREMDPLRQRTTEYIWFPRCCIIKVLVFVLYLSLSPMRSATHYEIYIIKIIRLKGSHPHPIATRPAATTQEKFQMIDDDELEYAEYAHINDRAKRAKKKKEIQLWAILKSI